MPNHVDVDLSGLHSLRLGICRISMNFMLPAEWHKICKLRRHCYDEHWWSWWPWSPASRSGRSRCARIVGCAVASLRTLGALLGSIWKPCEVTIFTLSNCSPLCCSRDFKGIVEQISKLSHCYTCTSSVASWTMVSWSPWALTR